MESNQRDNLLSVLQTIYNWRITIRNVCLLALVGSVVISLFLSNYYRSTTICYPASPQLSNPELMFGNTGLATQYFGTDQDLDRIAEVANSNELADFMVKKFSLYEHYDIDSTSETGPDKVRKRFRKLYSAQKNKNDALEISVEDTDPDFAADMANAALERTDIVARNLTRTAQARMLKAFEDLMTSKQGELVHLGDTLRILQEKYGIYDPKTQGEQLAAQLAIAEAELIRHRARLEVLESDPNIPRDTITYIRANLRAAERQRTQLMAGKSGGSSNDGSALLTVAHFNEGLPKVSVFRDLHAQASKQLSFDIERYNQIKAVYNASISAIHVVERAEPALRKSSPIRSLIVGVSVLAAFIFTVLAAIIADTYRDVDWKQFRLKSS
jgi:tyrosine-protein kinase Etk/Wzc